uniref:Uncharacterized protein n=1 Tax=viral metagenome TaxID=1070528 RepID=A0A6C0DUJ2_9ZZZZ
MGSCRSKEIGATIFLDNFIYPSTSKHQDIPTGGFCDMWSAINDWSNKNTGLESKLREYMKYNVCFESIIVLHYHQQTWVFHNMCPSSGASKFRVITL